MNKETAYKIIRYFADGLIPSRYRQQVMAWLIDDADKEAKDEALKRVWDETDDVMNADAMSQSVLRNQALRAHHGHQERARQIRLKVLKYAAVIFLPVALCLGTWFVASNQMASQAMLTECHVENGQTKVLRLSDGTQVRLNAGSSLFYPQRFNRFFSRRDVYLDGEAHFDVAKNSSQPFIVHVGNLKVKVLGTHFNVKAYPADELVTTTLEQGKVKVYEDKIAMTLLPNEQAVYNRISGNMTKRSVDSGKYNQWMNGKLLFDQTPLKAIIADLQRRYNVCIKTSPAVDLSQQFTMAFRADEGIDDVMNVLMKISGNLDYTYQQHTITLDVKKGGHNAGTVTK